jgi:hypothetical protein
MHAARTRLSIVLLSACALAACESGGEQASDAAVAVSNVQRPALCERDAAKDPVRDVFCADEPPAIDSLEDVLKLFEVDSREFDPLDPYAFDPTRKVAALGHSTALSGHVVSPLNPRVILIGESALLTFQRGVQRVEIVTGTAAGELVFYLLTFEQACNQEGCSPGDLYTPKVERDWTRVQLNDDEELKNTPSDCRQCHQRGVEKPKLLMRELESPWTHFFFAAQSTVEEFPGPNGSALMLDYIEAKGDELYGGVDFALVNEISVFNLERVVGEQPLLFDSATFDDERWPWTPGEGYATTMQGSPSWENAYEAFKRGEQLALPYLELRATDPQKQATLAKAYQRYMRGEIEADALPDMGDIHPDDARLRARIGLATEPDATPAEALIQACGACHNDVLDQSLSRARFNIALGRMSREEIETAIERIELPASAPGVMPPPEARQLAPEARERLLDYLRNDFDPEEVDPMLERAAMLGMTGGAEMDADGGQILLP